MPTARKTWQLLPLDRPAVERLAADLRVPPLVAQLLRNRGLEEVAAARRFLETPLSGLHPPEWLPGVADAAERLVQAVRQGRRICVYGDYDVDGLTGTAILLHCLRLMNASVDFYVPNRLEEGYGLNREALRQIAQAGAAVVVTVDCGIASIAEADAARQLGLELIVTDHHELKEQLPAAAVCVHPRLPDTDYPFGGLSGAGVAFKLAWALSQRACGSDKVSPQFREFLLDATALAALGLVADVVPLHDENRIFVKHGLHRLRQASSIGLRALLEAAGLASQTPLTADDIGYKLAPRLNAAGRLGCARLVVELLTTPSPQRAADLARHLEEQNQKRQKIEKHIYFQARHLVDENNMTDDPVLVLAHADWHPGIIGIVASRLVDLYGRPVLMISLRHDRDSGQLIGHGSGRSIAGFALHEALRACDGSLLSHGGHAAAAGFTLLADAITPFHQQLCAYAEQVFPHGPPPPRLILDTEIPLSALTLGLLRDLDHLEPYGSHNPPPLFLVGGLQVVGTPRKVGQDERHLSFRVRQQGATLRAIAFGMADRLEELMSQNGQCCLAFRPALNEWQGRRSVDLRVVDWQPGPKARLA